MSEKPKRIQRKRTKGWRMPPNTVYVGRPTIFGNRYEGMRAETAVALFKHDLESGVANFASHGFSLTPAVIRAHLRGKNLACWCALVDKSGKYVPCHADVLLSIANDLPMEQVIDENLRRAKGEAA